MLAHLLRQLLWRDEVEWLQRELADQEVAARAALQDDRQKGKRTQPDRAP